MSDQTESQIRAIDRLVSRVTGQPRRVKPGASGAVLRRQAKGLVTGSRGPLGSRAKRLLLAGSLAASGKKPGKGRKFGRTRRV